MKLTHIALAALAAFTPAAMRASTVSQTDPQAGGIGYKYTVTMGGLDSATFSNHVGAWSWEDDSLFDAGAGDPPVGWTHTSNWVALNVTVTSVFTIRIERDATVPWPSMAEPERLASVASMFPSFTIWRNWDNDVVPPAFAAKQEVIDAFDPDPVPADLGDWHTYNNRGAVEWAEDLVHVGHVDNSTLETIEATFTLTPGQYSIVIGSNAPATDTNRQGYKATLTTTQEFPVAVEDDDYFTGSAIKPLNVAVEKGVLANDSGLDPATDDIEITTPPARGSVTLNPDGSFTYTPGPYFVVTGSDTFAYRLLIDGDAGTPTTEGHVTISTFATAAGCHAGHIENEDTHATAGLAKINVTRLGRWTGSFNLNGVRFSAAGTVGVDGALTTRHTTALARKRHEDGEVNVDLDLHLASHAGADRHAHVHLQSGDDHFEAELLKSPFSAAAPAPFAGEHKVTLTVDTSSPGAPAAQTRGRLVVKPNGAAVLSGKIGDRTPFSCASALVEGAGPGPVLPIYASVYRAPIGSVIGELEFGGNAESDATGTLDVVKPTQTRPATAGFTITYDVTTTRP